MKNIKLTLSYNGANFSGWQNQKSGRTIQETIEKAIKKITGETVKLTGCGRTDSGVHAISYTANFKTSSRLAPEQIKNALNATLPEDIRIKTASIAKPDFHSRYDAKRKTYRYLILCGEESPFLRGFVCNVKGELDITRMKKAAAHFLGEHDFSAYQAAGSAIRNTTRKIYKITIKKERFTLDPSIKLIAIEITANGFLYKMARNIIGTLLYVGKGKLSPDAIPSILKSLDRRQSPPTSPSSGLYLKQVIY